MVPGFLLGCVTTWQGGTSTHQAIIDGVDQGVRFSSSVSNAHETAVSNKQVRVVIRSEVDGRILAKDKFNVLVGRFEGKHLVDTESGVATYMLYDSDRHVLVAKKAYRLSLGSLEGGSH